VAKLNDRQKLFCEEYLVDLNATEAARRAGYSEKTARAIGQENLTKPDIKAYIKKRQDARIDRTQITQDFVLMELMKIASANGTDFAVVGNRNRVSLVPTEDLPPEKRAAVAGVKKGAKGAVEVKTYDKVKALELLGKHLGMFEKRDGYDIEDVDDARKEVFGDG
jgi:phage terminase small subunit